MPGFGFLARPDASGIRGGSRLKPQQSADSFPYDRETGVLGRNTAKRPGQSSAGVSAPPPTPKDTRHTAWDSLSDIDFDDIEDAGSGDDDRKSFDIDMDDIDDVEEAAGVPFSLALSSRGGRMANYAPAATRMSAQGNVRNMSPDDLLALAGRGGDYPEEEHPEDMNAFRCHNKSGVWEELEDLIDMIVRGAEDLGMHVDRDDDGDMEASRSWRGLMPPETGAMK